MMGWLELETAEAVQTAEENAEFEYNFRPYSVFCDLCDAEAFASEKTLREGGWELGRGHAFCPAHN